MTATDFEKFIKLMMMTTSDQDHEALVALRKANAIIAGMNNNWEEVLRGKVKVVGIAQQQSYNATYVHHTNATEIDAMFETLLRTVPRQSSFRDFVEDVHGYWENRGYLTDAQYKALKRAMERNR
jgi:hypothetical protein